MKKLASTCVFYFQIGLWNPKDGINITKDYSEEVVEVADSLKNKTLIVTTIQVRTQQYSLHDRASLSTADTGRVSICYDLRVEQLIGVARLSHTISDVLL